MLLEGRIRKSIGGLYYVNAGGMDLCCKARGVFRKEGVRPLVGDFVQVEHADDADTIVQVLPRKNSLQRPPVANIDKLIIVSAAASPVPSTLVIDRLTAVACGKDIEPVVVFSKNDLDDVSDYVRLYRKAGFQSFSYSALTGEGIGQFRSLFAGCVCALTGNTGAGKSTLLNLLCPDLHLDTGEISKKLGRGRHTTRCVELFPALGGYIADTPGFSSMDPEFGEQIDKYELMHCFPDFEPYLQQCKFTGCSHTVEKGCAVLAALSRGLIAPSRHESYCLLYEQVKDVQDWQLKKKK